VDFKKHDEEKDWFYLGLLVGLYGRMQGEHHLEEIAVSLGLSPKWRAYYHEILKCEGKGLRVDRPFLDQKQAIKMVYLINFPMVLVLEMLFQLEVDSFSHQDISL
jgi:hypothetical protein